jgi:hypothetical protein
MANTHSVALALICEDILLRFPWEIHSAALALICEDILLTFPRELLLV